MHFTPTMLHQSAINQIDYLLTQDLDQMVLQVGEVLQEVKVGGNTNLTRFLPIRVFTPFHFM